MIALLTFYLRSKVNGFFYVTFYLWSKVNALIAFFRRNLLPSVEGCEGVGERNGQSEV